MTVTAILAAADRILSEVNAPRSRDGHCAARAQVVLDLVNAAITAYCRRPSADLGSRHYRKLGAIRARAVQAVQYARIHDRYHGSDDMQGYGIEMAACREAMARAGYAQAVR